MLDPAYTSMLQATFRRERLGTLTHLLIRSDEIPQEQSMFWEPTEWRALFQEGREVDCLHTQQISIT